MEYTSEGITQALTRALFNCVNDVTTKCLAQMERERAAAAARIPRPIRRRTFVPREHDVAHQRLFADYFAEQPRWGPTVFHRRVRMWRDLFLRIVRTLGDVMNTSSIGKTASADPDLRRCRSARLRSGSWPTAQQRICSTSTSTSGRQLAANVSRLFVS